MTIAPNNPAGTPSAGGTAFERWVSFVAFDGDLVYSLGAAFSPDAYGAFAADEQLLEFLPLRDFCQSGGDRTNRRVRAARVEASRTRHDSR